MTDCASFNWNVEYVFDYVPNLNFNGTSPIFSRNIDFYENCEWNEKTKELSIKRTKISETKSFSLEFIYLG